MYFPNIIDYRFLQVLHIIYQTAQLALPLPNPLKQLRSNIAPSRALWQTRQLSAGEKLAWERDADLFLLLTIFFFNLFIFLMFQLLLHAISKFKSYRMLKHFHLKRMLLVRWLHSLNQIKWQPLEQSLIFSEVL